MSFRWQSRVGLINTGHVTPHGDTKGFPKGYDAETFQIPFGGGQLRRIYSQQNGFDH